MVGVLWTLTIGAGCFITEDELFKKQQIMNQHTYNK